MVILSTAPALSAAQLQAYHTTDPALSNAPILVLYGPSVTSANVPNSARAQVHIFTPAGYQSYPRLATSPTTPLYSAVTCLSKEEQGDEIVRALAYSIFKYFGELPEVAKREWTRLGTPAPARNLGTLFTAAHAAAIASRLLPLDNSAVIARQLDAAFASQAVSSLDVDVVLPSGSIRDTSKEEERVDTEREDVDSDIQRYGTYASLIKQFGENAFIPTSKIRRAPSRPTALNRSTTFAKKQKETLRRELCEFVNTEESYVEKLNTLVHEIASGFRAQAILRSSVAGGLDEKRLEQLFPPSVNTILDLNSSFLDAIRQLLEATEDCAISDIESTVDSSSAHFESTGEKDDPTGATAFARALLTWFPRFSGCYNEYIQAQPNFARLVKDFTSESNSYYSQRIQEIGEQRLMSLLIEPVQRLARYSLYIENILKQLPLRHPALKLFSKAKDTIAEVCSQDRPGSASSRLARMTSLISGWPSAFRPHGRFINAIDAVEITGPDNVNGERSDASEMLLLLFAGHLVLIRKLGQHSMSSRSFTAEVEQSGSYLQSSSRDPGLLYSGHKSLSDIVCMEGLDGNNSFKFVPSRAPLPKALVSPSDARIQQFRLGASDRRVSRWLLEVTKARVEGRVSETQREGPKWEARLTEGAINELTLFSSILEECTEDALSRDQSGSTVIVIDAAKGVRKLTPGDCGIETVASVYLEGQGFYRLEIDALNERGTRDMVTEAEFLPVLTKRRKYTARPDSRMVLDIHSVAVGNLLQMRSQIRNPTLTVYLLQHQTSVINSIVTPPQRQNRNTNRSRHKRTASPVKLLSSLFSNASLKDADSPSKPTIANARSSTAVTHNEILQSTQGFFDPHVARNANQSPAKTTQVVNKVNEERADSFESLERTLSCYLLALQARKGNAVGSVVSRRSFADQAIVNNLYNALLEDPDDHERAAQAPVDILFAAFEQFIKAPWKDRLGPVIRDDMLVDLQTRMEVLNPLDYEEYEECRLAELAPQNRRALSGIVKTLAELLDGTRNDGDRGALTAAMAEIVICDADPHVFIPLFDRFVENEEAVATQIHATAVAHASVSSNMTQTTKTGSVSSKASSLSRRLGFGSVRRENSKAEQTRGVGHLLRMGSKKLLSQDPALERPLIGRTQSQDLSSQMTSLRRPGSRDHPGLPGNDSRPATGQSSQANSGPPSSAGTPARESGKCKRSRRSSLSDLATLQTPSASPFWTNSASKRVEGIFDAPSTAASPSRLRVPETPTKSASVRCSSPNKENITPLHRSYTTRDGYTSKTSKAGDQHSALQSAFTQTFSPPSAIEDGDDMKPTMAQLVKSPLSERAASGNSMAPTHPAIQKSTAIESPKKLRVQSPTKIRERLQGNQAAIATAQSSMQAEMEKIGRELAELDLRPKASPERQKQVIVTNINTRLKALENKVAHLSKNLTEHAEILEVDLNASLQAAHRKNKTLDVELQRANAENAALYSRMNDELMGLFNQVKTGNGLDELRRALRASQDETLKWKTKAANLARDNADLRSLID